MSETPVPPPPPPSSGDEPTPTPAEGAAPPPPPAEPVAQPTADAPADVPPPPPAYGDQPAPPPVEQPVEQPGEQQGYAPPPAYGQPAAPQQWAGQGGYMTPDEKTWGGAAHWSALVASLVGLAFLGPLLVLLMKGNESPYIRAQAVESLNFQITMAIAGIVAAFSLLILVGLLLLPLVGLWWLIFTIIGSIKSSSGEMYRYPATIRLVS